MTIKLNEFKSIPEKKTLIMCGIFASLRKKKRGGGETWLVLAQPIE